VFSSRVIWYLWLAGCNAGVTSLMIFQLSSSRLFHHLFHGHPTTASHSFQRFFPYFTRSLSVSRSGLLVWPTKINPTVQKIGLINKPRPFSSSILKSIALAGLGLSLATWNKSAIRCEGMYLVTSFGIHTKVSVTSS
jgi:hypothetical protein